MYAICNARLMAQITNQSQTTKTKHSVLNPSDPRTPQTQSGISQPTANIYCMRKIYLNLKVGFEKYLQRYTVFLESSRRCKRRRKSNVIV